MFNMQTKIAGRRARRRFTSEFKAGAVRLVLEEGKTIGSVARELDLVPSALGSWVARVGWAVSAVNDRHLTIKALEMALKRRCPGVGLLHHSDQGCTYASEDYRALLAFNGITCSMSRRGDCFDNAVMESFFSTVKSELGERFESYGTAKMELFDYIEVFYNQRRRHSTLGLISPAAYERQAQAA